jgi:hypothetical protein
VVGYFGGALGPTQAGSGYRPVDMAVAEKGKSVTLAARAVDRAMRCREEDVVGPALQQLTAVDDKRVGDGECIDAGPFSRSTSCGFNSTASIRDARW